MQINKVACQLSTLCFCYMFTATSLANIILLVKVKIQTLQCFVSTHATSLYTSKCCAQQGDDNMLTEYRGSK